MTVSKTFTKLDILYLAMLLIGFVFQIPAQYKHIKTDEDISIADRKYFFGLIFGVFVFSFLLIFTIQEFY